jgi:hypothetical protein
MLKLKEDLKRVSFSIKNLSSWVDLNSNTFCVSPLVRELLKDLTKQYDKSENDLKALQSVGQVKHKLILS